MTDFSAPCASSHRHPRSSQGTMRSPPPRWRLLLRLLLADDAMSNRRRARCQGNGKPKTATRIRVAWEKLHDHEGASAPATRARCWFFAVEACGFCPKQIRTPRLSGSFHDRVLDRRYFSSRVRSRVLFFVPLRRRAFLHFFCAGVLTTHLRLHGRTEGLTICGCRASQLFVE